MKNKQELPNFDATAKRAQQVLAGAYDGRFKNKTFLDRKKESDKRAARGKFSWV